MRTSVLELFEKAVGLTEEDRATLAGLLIESLETEVDEGVEAVWREEVERRLAQLDSGAVETVSWEVLRARLLQGSNGSEN